MSAGALRGPPLPSPWVQQGVVSVKPAGGPLSSGPSVCLCPSGEVEEEVENPEMVDLPEKLKHQLRHRELFLSRQLESLPATHIRYPEAPGGREALPAAADARASLTEGSAASLCSTRPSPSSPTWSGR